MPCMLPDAAACTLLARYATLPASCCHCCGSMPLLSALPPSSTACTAAHVDALWQRPQVYESCSNNKHHTRSPGHGSRVRQGMGATQPNTCSVICIPYSKASSMSKRSLTFSVHRRGILPYLHLRNLLLHYASNAVHQGLRVKADLARCIADSPQALLVVLAAPATSVPPACSCRTAVTPAPPALRAPGSWPDCSRSTAGLQEAGPAGSAPPSAADTGTPRAQHGGGGGRRHGDG